MRKRVAIALIIGFLFIGLLPVFNVGCRPQRTLQKATLMLDWTPNTNHTGIYVAKDKGWYKDQGIDLEIVEPAEGALPVQVVAAGQADFGISFEEEVTHARSVDVPVVSIAAIIQHNTSGFASPKEKNITRPKDFEGKKYGAFGSPIENEVLSVLMAADGADVSKIEFVDVGFADFFVVTQKDVDFMWIFYAWTGIEAEVKGTPINIVMLNKWFDSLPDYYTPVIITSEKEISEKPDMIKKFMKATSLGYEFAISNPQEAAEILIKNVPEINAELVKRSQQWLAKEYKSDAPRWGEQKLEVWQNYPGWMFERGLLPKAIDAEKVFTNEFLP
ncbi:MAG: ABC transporter substrate-binding protein [Actinobacteria bacterium]|nr:ABC transporter substrate-binding protein [Actinomycetota bacterium]